MAIGPLCVCYLVLFFRPIGNRGLFGSGRMFYSGVGYILWAGGRILFSFFVGVFYSLRVFGSIVWVHYLVSF